MYIVVVNTVSLESANFPHVGRVLFGGKASPLIRASARVQTLIDTLTRHLHPVNNRSFSIVLYFCQHDSVTTKMQWNWLSTVPYCVSIRYHRHRWMWLVLLALMMNYGSQNYGE